MRINFTIDYINPFGGMKTSAEVAKRLAERGHKITLTLVRPQNLIFDWGQEAVYTRSWSRHLFRKFIRIWNNLLGFDNKVYIFDSQREDLAKITPSCDINFAQHIGSVFAVFDSKKGIPFHHLQHYEPWCWPDDDFIKHKFEESLYLPIFRSVNSTWLHNKMKSEHNLDLPIINPGIDHNKFFPRTIKKRNLGKKRIVSFGKSLKWKGLDDLFEAMRLVFQKNSNIELILFGAQPLRYKRIDIPYKFLYNISDEELANLYSSADVVVCPSWYESFPGPPIEAMACGAPVVTTSIGVEDYAKNEENALVVPPRQPFKLAEAILRLLEDKQLSDKFREKGPETARQFTWEKTTDKFESLFKSLIFK